jgi:hypothetical protein
MPIPRNQKKGKPKLWARRFIKYASRSLFIFMVARVIAFYISPEPLPSTSISHGTKRNADTRDMARTKLQTPDTTTSTTTSQKKIGSVIIVNEEDIDNVSNATTPFEITYFTSKPECRPLLPNQVSMTLTTQLSLDRMWIMKHQCNRWPAPYPISIAVYLPPHHSSSDDNKNESTHVVKELETNLGCDLSRMTITLLKGSPTSGAAMSQYPVNTLRNLALEGVQTTHAAYIDSDFLISKGLYDHLMTTAAIVANDPKAAMVMPAFEYLQECTFSSQEEAVACLTSELDASVPETQEDLFPLLLDRNSQRRPRVQRGFQNFNGKNRFHSTTMYKTWINNQSTPVPIPCIKTLAYEPYLAVRVCRDLPEFPRVFKGWGFNKVIWIMLLLKKLGYTLWQVPRGFVMHLPHLESVSRKSTDGHPPEFDRYLEWLGTVPNHPDRLPNCTAWKNKFGKLQP